MPVLSAYALVLSFLLILLYPVHSNGRAICSSWSTTVGQDNIDADGECIWGHTSVHEYPSKHCRSGHHECACVSKDEAKEGRNSLKDTRIILGSIGLAVGGIIAVASTYMLRQNSSNLAKIPWILFPLSILAGAVAVITSGLTLDMEAYFHGCDT